MQTAPINQISFKPSALNFKGYKDVTNSATGDEITRFYIPPFDKQKFDAVMELVALSQNSKGEWVVSDSQVSKSLTEFKPKFTKDNAIDVPHDILLRIADSVKDGAIGYRFIFTEKGASKDKDGKAATNGKELNTYYVHDMGVVSSPLYDSAGSGYRYSVITKKQIMPKISGTIYHAYFDSLAPQKEAIENIKTRTHFNKAGTTLKSVIDKIKEPDSFADPYEYVLSTPIFGKDAVSSSGYWTSNPYQISSSIGNIDDFKELMTTLFDKGKSWIADGAFTSMGLSSYQASNVLMYGKNSPYFNWLKFEENGNPILGVFPVDVSESFNLKNLGLKNVRFKIVNSPNSADYDKSQRTYIQFYDDRLVTDEQRDSKNLINYTKQNSDDIYDVGLYTNSVTPYKFELDVTSNDKIRHLKTLDALSDKSLADIDLNEISTSFEFFSLAPRNKAAYMSQWAGSNELIKMNLNGSKNGKSYEQVQARNYIYNVASFWTKTTADALLLHLAETFANDKNSATEKIATDFKVSKSELDKVKENIADENYNSKVREELNNYKNDLILKEVAGFPLEAIEFADDLTAILGSNLITVRPIDFSHQNLSRYELVKENKNGGDYTDIAAQFGYHYPQSAKYANEIIRTELTPFVSTVLSKMNEILVNNNPKNSIFNAEGDLTEFGAYVVKNVTSDIVKNIIVKSLFGDEVFTDGKINYNALNKCGLTNLGITKANCETPAKQADAVINIFSKKLVNLSKTDESQKLAEMLAEPFKKLSLEDFRASEATMNFLGAGLNWRFDATKEVGNIEQVYNYSMDFHSLWNEIIDFWGNFISSVRKENPDSYIISEITDIGELYEDSKKSELKAVDFKNDINPQLATRRFFDETGATTDTDYDYTFNSVPIFFSYNREGKPRRNLLTSKDMMHKLLQENFINNSPLTTIINSHTALGNPDKERILFDLALVDLKYYLNLNNYSNPEFLANYAKLVQDVTKLNIKNHITGAQIKNVSPEAVVVGKLYKDNLHKIINKIFDENISDDAEGYIMSAVADLALGRTENDRLENIARARNFGTDDFENALKAIVQRAQFLAKNDNKAEIAELIKKNENNIIVNTHKSILKKPMQDFAKMWELMNVTVGNPTMNAGDEYGITGFETPWGNVTGKSRMALNHDIVNQEGREYIKEFKNRLDSISNLHNLTAADLGFKKTVDKNGDNIYPLKALSTGTPIIIDERSSNNRMSQITGMYKYDDKGS